MYRWTNLLAGVILAISTVALAQDQPSNQQTPEDAFEARQLIAWSSLQKPQPAPQPLPPPDTAIPQPDQPSDQQSKAPGDPQNEDSPAQTFTGKIVKDGAEYVLRAANNTTYALIEQSEVKQYENQNVRVVGKIETGTNRIHVVKIELMS